tara:strand:+ start:281 stop:430 length:150 start_codon:yes stop_codon:yes gene_type:complete
MQGLRKRAKETTRYVITGVVMVGFVYASFVVMSVKLARAEKQERSQWSR